MVSLGRDYMLTHWWLAVLPSIIIVVLMLRYFPDRRLAAEIDWILN